MPIYEYKCGGCNRRVSIFFPSFSTAESRTAAGENKCPRCGSPDLSRLISRARALRVAGSSGGGDFEGMGDGPEDMGGMESMLAGIDDEDPRAIARWARQMKDQLGDEVDLGPEFDRALARIEAGEDPDKVMEDMDPDALGDMGDDEALDDAADDFDSSL